MPRKKSRGKKKVPTNSPDKTLTTITATSATVRTETILRVTATIAATAVIISLIGIWYSLSYPAFSFITTYEPLLHGFDNNSSNSVSLTWTAPGDDDLVGQASAYDIRYSDVPLTEESWGTATQLSDEPHPGPAGTHETFLATGLAPNTTYYFALKTLDNAGNASTLSNIAVRATTCVEAWECSAWSSCSAGVQTRQCSDLNACGTTVERPPLEQACTGGAPTCTESWTCGTWSPCDEGQQTRTCEDGNACGSDAYRPGIQRSCELSAPTGGGVAAQETFIVTVPNRGGGPQVRIFDSDGNLQWQWFAYDTELHCGLNVAVGDLGGDGIDEVVVAPDAGCAPLVKVFTFEGHLLNQFYAYAEEFDGGVNLSIGDVDNAFPAEIVVAPASKGGPNVRIFGYRDGSFVPTTIHFFAYNRTFRGGVDVAVADLDADGTPEIVTAPSLGGGPHVRFFRFENGQFVPNILGFFAYSDAFRGGVDLAVGDINNDGYAEIGASPYARGGPHVRLFSRKATGTIGALSPGFFAFHPEFRGGLSLAFGDIDGNERDEIIAAVKTSDQALVRIYRPDGAVVLREFLAYPSSVRTGIDIAVGTFLPPR